MKLPPFSRLVPACAPRVKEKLPMMEQHLRRGHFNSFGIHLLLVVSCSNLRAICAIILLGAAAAVERRSAYLTHISCLHRHRPNGEICIIQMSKTVISAAG